MADSIKISTQVLIDTAGKVRTINANLDDKLSEINQKMNALKSSWKSESGESIREAMNALKPNFEQYKSVVESYAKFLEETAQQYETTETVITTNANQFK